MTVAEGPFETQAAAAERPAWTPTQMAWRRFRRHKSHRGRFFLQREVRQLQ
jgi:hypothetical protein